MNAQGLCHGCRELAPIDQTSHCVNCGGNPQPKRPRRPRKPPPASNFRATWPIHNPDLDVDTAARIATPLLPAVLATEPAITETGHPAWSIQPATNDDITARPDEPPFTHILVAEIPVILRKAAAA